MGGKPHVIFIPHPSEGHVAPVMKLAYKLAHLGIKVTFVNAEFIHDRIMDALPHKLNDKIPISFVSVSPWNPEHLLWSFQVDEDAQKLIFIHFVRDIAENVKICNEVLANSFDQLETSACNLIPKILPIGPLRPSDYLGPFAGDIRAEDSTCLSWLDQQPNSSVIYAAFGSSVVCSQEQLHELAIGFEIISRPFLWVVRSDFTEGTVAEFPFYSMLLFSLWMEFNHGGCKHGCAFSMLALCIRSISQQGSDLQNLGLVILPHLIACLQSFNFTVRCVDFDL